MEKIVVIFGGASVEHDVSIITGLQAINILRESYEVFAVYMSLENEFYLTKNLNPKDYYDKEVITSKAKRVTFFDGKMFYVKKNKCVFLTDFYAVLNCCHGGVGENGVLASYFEMCNVKISSAEGLGSAICMDKFLTKEIAKSLNIPTVEGVRVTKDNFDESLLTIKKSLNSDLIIKPNSLGSSIGVVRTTQEGLKEQVLKCLHLDSNVLVENCVTNMQELNCAVFKRKGDLCLSQIEKVGGKTNFLTFDDKYISKESKREIPAKISEKLKNQIYDYTKKVYTALNLRGVVRLDFIYDLDSKKLYLNEVNTVPGSLAFYLYEGMGINYTMLCEAMLEEARIAKKQTYFESDILSKTGLKVK